MQVNLSTWVSAKSGTWNVGSIGQTPAFNMRSFNIIVPGLGHLDDAAL